MSGAASTRPEVIVGEALPGGYRVDRYLASGGFAWIFQARDPRGQTCALKIPYEITRLTLRLFEREIKVMRSLPPSPYRVAYVGDGLTFKGVPFLAMEYVDGPTLRHVLAATPIFSAGFLVAKVQTKYERSEAIVLWQHLWVGIVMAPLAFARSRQ